MDIEACEGRWYEACAEVETSVLGVRWADYGVLGVEYSPGCSVGDVGYCSTTY